MRARLLVAALGLGALTVGRPAPALAVTDSVLVRVAGSISGRAGGYVEVPIAVDLSGAPGRALGSYSATLRFNPALLEYQGIVNEGFAAPQVNTNHAGDSGMVVLAAIQPPGASGTVVLFNARFYVLSDTGQSPVTISFSEMSATATSVTPFESLLPLLKVVNGTFCKSLGQWGDADGDGQSNSLDALVALSTVVGIPVDTTVMKPGLMDVDADGKVTSRDALIVLSYGVGLPVSGYRVLLTAPGACGTGDATMITITPDSLELQVGQSVNLLFDARDASGRSVSVDSGAVTSSNPSVANWVHQYEGADMLQARAPGVAVFTVAIGPGIAATFKVVVLARRSTWYVDVLRASQAPVQLGNQAFPFEFIGDALNLAHDGDTVLVASGTYEEEVSADVAVTILGDSTSRPVLDPRGAPDWYSYYEALDLEPDAGQIVVANLVVRAGATRLGAHDITVRNVRIEGLGTNSSSALDLWTAQPYEDAPPARASGPQRSGVPEEPGNVLVDGVVVLADSTSNGITVELADTVVIRNSSVTRAIAGTYAYCGAGPYENGGIVIQQASVSVVQGNAVVNPACQGIAAFDPGYTPLIGDVGRATISRNRVTGAPGTGIAAGTRLVALDHNAVRNTGTAFRYTNGATVGIHVIRYGQGTPDSVTSLADTVLNSGGRGFAVDTAGAATLDSLVVSGTGQDSSGSGSYGVDLEYGGHFALSHSHISNTNNEDAVSVQGEHSVLRSHGNRIVGSGYDGISLWYYNYGGHCDGECAPSARSGPQRVGPYVGGPDSLISVADTILGANDDGIYVEYGVYALVDSVVVDSVGYDGVQAENVGRVVVQNSSIRRGGDDAIDLYIVDSISILHNRLVNNPGGALYLEQSVDTARIYGTIADSSALLAGWSGIVIWGTNILMDSSLVSNSGYAGIEFEGGAGGRVQRSRIESNLYGLQLDCCGYDSVVVRQSTIQHNVVAGAVNQNTEYGAMLDADTNYWGDPNGPTCRVEGPCSGLGSGDSVLTSRVTFLGWLTSAPVTPAAPFRAIAAGRVLSRRAAAPLAALPGSSQTHRATVRRASGAMRPGVTRAPSAVNAAAIRGAASPSAPQRSPHRQPAAWHAPSKAKTHAMQIIVKQRT